MKLRVMRGGPGQRRFVPPRNRNFVSRAARREAGDSRDGCIARLGAVGLVVAIWDSEQFACFNVQHLKSVTTAATLAFPLIGFASYPNVHAKQLIHSGRSDHWITSSLVTRKRDYRRVFELTAVLTGSQHRSGSSNKALSKKREVPLLPVFVGGERNDRVFVLRH